MATEWQLAERDYLIGQALPGWDAERVGDMPAWHLGRIIQIHLVYRDAEMRRLALLVANALVGG